VATSELIPPGLDLYSQADYVNRKFKRLTTIASFIFGIVFLLLIFELTGIIPISPFQPDITNPLSATQRPTPVR